MFFTYVVGALNWIGYAIGLASGSFELYERFIARETNTPDAVAGSLKAGALELAGEKAQAEGNLEESRENFLQADSIYTSLKAKKASKQVKKRLAQLDAMERAKSSPKSDQAVRDLERSIARLTELRQWLEQDEGLVTLVDSVIGQQVAAAGRRQRITAVILLVFSIIFGWLLYWLFSSDILTSLFH